MRTDHRPYWMRRAYDGYQLWWQRRFLEPQFDRVGDGLDVTLPWKVTVIGEKVDIGNQVHIRTHADGGVLFCTWPNEGKRGTIRIGDYCLITPGARILAARSITLGDNTMLGSNVLISDSDWHDLYDRTSAPGDGAPIVTGKNAWIGERSIICKGVTIGENSIIGAGSVVTKDIPSNVVAAGNPAKVVKEFDPTREFTTRETIFADPKKLYDDTWGLYKWLTRNNSSLGWLRTKIKPNRED